MPNKKLSDVTVGDLLEGALTTSLYVAAVPAGVVLGIAVVPWMCVAWFLRGLKFRK